MGKDILPLLLAIFIYTFIVNLELKIFHIAFNLAVYSGLMVDDIFEVIWKIIFYSMINVFV